MLWPYCNTQCNHQCSALVSVVHAARHRPGSGRLLRGLERELGAVRKFQLCQQPAHVAAHRVEADREFVGDALVGEAAVVRKDEAASSERSRGKSAVRLTRRPAKATQKGDLWTVTRDNGEVYEVPLAAIEGG